MRAIKAATMTMMMAMKMRLTVTAAAMIVLDETDGEVGVVMSVTGGSWGLVEVTHVSLAMSTEERQRVITITFCISYLPFTKNTTLQGLLARFVPA